MRVAEPVVIVALLLLAIWKATKGANAGGVSSSRWIWEGIIKGSDPILTLLEGFGTVLIIQKSSQVVRRLAAKSDGYQVKADTFKIEEEPTFLAPQIAFLTTNFAILFS